MIDGDRWRQVGDDLEGRIDELYALPLDRFTAERDALASRLRAGGDQEGAATVKALRKPVVAVWSLNTLAREDPAGVAQLADLGVRLRDAQRRAMSGGDAEPLRTALEERRVLVSRLAARARDILERVGAGGATQGDDVVATLEAAAVDEDAAAALRAGRLSRPMRPPTGFGDAGALTVLPGGRGRSEHATEENDRDSAALGRARELRRELGAAETRRRRTDDALRKARERLEQAERRRAEAKDAMRAAEAEARGAALDAKRLEAALSKLKRSP